MSLVNDFMERFCLMEKIRVSDGEGGFNTAWSAGAEFAAAIVQDDSTLAKLAEKQGVVNNYSVFTDKNVHLEFPDVIKRLSDGQTFRITQAPVSTPKSASLNMSKVSAERWPLT